LRREHRRSSDRNALPERVVITGANGSVGTTLRQGLRQRVATLRLVDMVPILSSDGEEAVICDIADLDAMRTAMRDMDACIHLAAISTEAQFPEILRSNIIGTWAVFQAARLEGCRRVVFASSNHVTGFAPVGERVTAGSAFQPDTYYGVSKLTGEGIGSLYHDKFGLEVACVRIGSFAERPTESRHLSTWLSPRDCVNLFEACLTAKDLGFSIVYGVSLNKRGWWDLREARRLGYDPIDDAESYASEIPEGSPGPYQGGDEFTDPFITI
jgi:uronate dehydrogenase